MSASSPICYEVASQGGDVNEISNQLNQDVLRLTKNNSGDTWTSLWVSSLDSGGSGGAEMGTLYWSNTATPNLSTLTTNFTFKFGDFGAAVQGNVLSLPAAANFDPTAKYVFFIAGPNACGNNNDYLFWKATTSTPGSLVNTATVSTPAGVTDTNPGNNSATDTDTPGNGNVDLAITKTDGTPTYVPGTSTTYTIVVSNPGSVAVNNATVNDTFPAGISSMSWTAVASSGASVGQASGTGNISDSVSLIPGATVTFTVVAQISASATGNVVNTVTVSTPPGVTDTNPGNYTATDTDTPAPGSITGHKYLDVTGNGASSDDTPLGGVTINLYRDVNNTGVLDSTDGAPYKTTTTASTGDVGSYSFTRQSGPGHVLRAGGRPERLRHDFPDQLDVLHRHRGEWCDVVRQRLLRCGGV